MPASFRVSMNKEGYFQNFSFVNVHFKPNKVKLLEECDVKY